jgi:predicted MFS family arabinose efflux permease
MTIDNSPPAAAPVLSAAPARNLAITSPRLKAGLFVIEGLNSMSTAWFFYYLYFVMRDKHGFGAMENFLLAAALGLAYAVAAILGGRFAQKAGCLVSLRLGTLVMMAAFALESQTLALWPVMGLAMLANLGMCFTWPALEALVSEGESPRRLQNLIGIYNCVWALASGFAYFVGGAMIERWGWNSIFLVPSAIQMVEVLLVMWIEKQAPLQRRPAIVNVISNAPPPVAPIRSPVPPKTFLKMALLANPFAYLAINTLFSFMPTIAARLNLDTMRTGFLCSLWLFTRAGAFALLWLWPKWHYRFRYLAASFIAMVAAFAAMLLTVNLQLLVTAEVIFGVAVGLIYYSSLFYSMDVGDTKGEHGGIHEGAIGAGSCAGPAMAFCGLYFFPLNPSSGAYAVTLLMLCGLSGLYWLRYRD